MVLSVHEVTRGASQTTWLRSDANYLVNAKRHAREKRRVPRICLHAKTTSHCVPQPLTTRFNMWRIITVMYATNEIPHYSLSLFLRRENNFTIFYVLNRVFVLETRCKRYRFMVYLCGINNFYNTIELCDIKYQIMNAKWISERGHERCHVLNRFRSEMTVFVLNRVGVWRHRSKTYQLRLRFLSLQNLPLVPEGSFLFLFLLDPHMTTLQEDGNAMASL